MLGVACDIDKLGEAIFDGVVADAVDGNGADLSVADGEVGCLFTDGPCFLLIDFADASGKAALKVAEGIGTHTLDGGAAFDPACEEVAESTGTRELNVTVGVFLAAGELLSNGAALGVGDAFGDGDDAAAIFLIGSFHVLEEFRFGEGALGHVDEVRAVVGVLLGEGGSGGQEACVAAHDDADIYAGDGAVIEVNAGESLGDEFCGRTVAGAMIGDAEIVVDGFGDVDDAEVVSGFFRFFVDDAAGVCAVVTAAVEEVADVVGLADFENFAAVGDVGFVACGEEAAGGSACDGFEVVEGGVGEVDEVFVDDAPYAVECAVDAVDLWVAAGFEDGTDDALVDDGCGSAALGNENFSCDRHRTCSVREIEFRLENSRENRETPLAVDGILSQLNGYFVKREKNFRGYGDSEGDIGDGPEERAYRS